MDIQKRTNIIIVSVLVLLNLLIYFNSINNDFIWDDHKIVKENPYIRDTKHIKKLLTMEDTIPNFPGTGLFRPLVNITYLLDYKIHQGKPYGYRLTNIVFSILCSIALFFLALLITKSRLLSFIAAVIFSAQAVHVEAVTYIVGRNNVICTLFILLSLYYYVKNAKESKSSYLVYSLLFLFLGATAKEFAFVVPVIFILYDYTFSEEFSLQKGLVRYALAFAAIFAFIIYKSFIIPPGELFVFEPHSFYKRILTTFPIMMKYIGMQIVPHNLSVYIGLPQSESFLEPKVLFSFLPLAALIFFVFRSRKRDKLLFFSFFAYFILLIPVSNVVLVVRASEAMMADRWLYPASAASSILFAHLILTVCRKRAALVPVVAIGFVMFLSAFTMQRNSVFKNNFSFFTDTLSSTPGSSIIRNNLANEYSRQGRYDEAEKQYLTAIDYNPDDPMPYYNLGNIFTIKKDWQKALKYFNESYKRAPDYPPAAYSIGYALSALGNIDESSRFYNIAISLNPQYYRPYFDLALNYYKQKRIDESLELLRTVFRSSPDETEREKAGQLIQAVEKEIELSK